MRVDRRNSMTQDMYRGVKRAAIPADRETDIDVLVLTGTDDVFMATRLADRVGVGNAKWVMFAMETFDAERAMQMGLVQQVAPDKELDAVVNELDAVVNALVASAAEGALAGRGVIKDDVNRQLRPHDFRVFHRSIMNPEMRAGMSAFLEKRDPAWPRDRPPPPPPPPPRTGRAGDCSTVIWGAGSAGASGSAVAVVGDEGVDGTGNPRDGRGDDQPADDAPEASGGDQGATDGEVATMGTAVRVDPVGRRGDIGLGQAEVVEIERLPRRDIGPGGQTGLRPPCR